MASVSMFGLHQVFYAVSWTKIGVVADLLRNGPVIRKTTMILEDECQDFFHTFNGFCPASTTLAKDLRHAQSLFGAETTFLKAKKQQMWGLAEK